MISRIRSSSVMRRQPREFGVAERRALMNCVDGRDRELSEKFMPLHHFAERWRKR